MTTLTVTFLTPAFTPSLPFCSLFRGNPSSSASQFSCPCHTFQPLANQCSQFTRPTILSLTTVGGQSFTEWAQSIGIRMPSLTLTTFPANKLSRLSDRGLCATEPIKKRASLIVVPSEFALEVTTTADERAPRRFALSRATWRELPWFVRLALVLLSVRNDEQHPLHGWSKSLPTTVDVPHHWADADIAWLQSPRMSSQIDDQRRTYRNCFQRITNALPDVEISYDEFVWAIDCVRSRAFAGPLEPAPFRERLKLTLFVVGNTFLWPSLNILPWENAINGGLTAIFALATFDIIFPRVLRVLNGMELRRYAMVPGVDMFNHDGVRSRDAQVEYRYFTDSYDVLSAENYDRGDQVFISYGPQSNDSFLQYYAFVEDENPADTFVFDDDITQQLKLPRGRLIAHKGGFDSSVVRAVVKQTGGNQDKAVTLLHEICQMQLGRFETTAKQDTKILNDEDRSPRSRLAVRYRRAKKLLLQNIVDRWDGTF